jgi:hypothetical protein
MEAAQAAAETAGTGPGALASADPVDPLVNGTEPAATDDTAGDEPDAGAEAEDDSAASSNGRRRRTRRPRAKAASSDPND